MHDVRPKVLSHSAFQLPMGERKVNWFRSKLLLCCLLVIVGATAAYAQNWPLPSALPEARQILSDLGLATG